MGRKPISRRIVRIILDKASSNPQIYECDGRGRPIHRFPRFQANRLQELEKTPLTIYKTPAPPPGGIDTGDLTPFDSTPADGRVEIESGDRVIFEAFTSDDFDQNLALDDSASADEEWDFLGVQPSALATQRSKPQ
jgi:hypothetical protein